MKGGGGTVMKKGKRKASRVEPERDAHDHTLFFDRLVNLIPPRFYLPAAAADGGDADNKPYFHKLTEAEKAAQKKKSRENIKKARETRLDPEKSSTTMDLLGQSFKKAEQTGGGGCGGGDDDEFRGLREPGSTTLEGLRARLRGRIEELRVCRKGSGRSSNKAERTDGGSGGGDGGDEVRGLGEPESTTFEGLPDKGEGRTKGEREEREDAAEKGLSFGRMKVGGEQGRETKETKKMKVEEAERVKAGRGEEAGRAYSWEAAGRRASGEKVHDDPKLLRKRMGKERRRKEKSRREWAERREATETARKQKQQKRADNISERAREKKRRKIERREKKLMRPGPAPQAGAAEQGI